MPAQDLINASNCLSCIPTGLQMRVLIYLFATIAGVPTDAQTLINNANCLSCIPAGSQMEVLISLADQILAGGGGGGGSGEVLCGAADPVAAPTGSCALYVNTVSTALFYWDGAAWQLKA